ncbi:MAG: glutathione transport system substrate-binding protein [Pseudonocardiales bacterium]|jgi:peptide/nickel transport system substrate-binding protein|nr:glutathione transport system substrate-binding protein [Pseudonocardiales bacterium]MDT7655746.1 glutathione transport system substrate-binding protein [Pseudonocardiales bacterium]
MRGTSTGVLRGAALSRTALSRSRAGTAIRGLALAAVAALSLAACSAGPGSAGGGGGDVDQQQTLNPGTIGGADQPYTRPKVPDIGEVSVSLDESFQDYNNNTGAANSQANQYFSELFSPSPYFVDSDFSLKVDKDYMESVTVKSTSPQVVEWKWRPDAVWSDGAPVGCKDMYLLYLAAVSPAKASGGSQAFDSSPTGYSQISKFECSPDGKTVTVTFGTPLADYRGLWSQAWLSGGQLLPAHILEQRTGIPDITKLPLDRDTPEVQKAAQFFTKGWGDFDATNDLSAGPYILQSATRNQRAVLVRNPKWWGSPGGPAKITTTAVTDSQAMVQQLLNKEVQVIAPQADSTVAEQVRAGGDFSVFARGGQTYEHLDFNMGRPLFRDHPELRHAVADCVNRQDIVDKLVKSVDPNAKPLGAFLINPNEAGYQDHYPGVGTGDVAGAKKLMEDAGWALGPDGIYAKGGQRASFRVGHKLVDRRGQTVQLMQASCKPAGIEMIDAGNEAFNDQQLPAGDFDAALFAWVGSSIKSTLTPNYTSKAKGGVANYNNYSNPQVDDLLSKANTQLDFTQRLATFNQADDIMAKDMHSLPLFQLPDFACADRSYSPISYLSTGGALWNVFAWTKSL